MQWAHGLTVTTTGLDKHDKDAIRQDVEAAGGRYSPNLSKRTTHLVTPEVVSNVTEKLAAAAAGPGQQRFRALQVVSKCWVSASAGLRCRADEEQFAPLLPPPGANVRCDNNTAPARQAAVASSAAASAAAGPNAGAGGPQTPWVVHFSQMPDDSVYGAQQQQSSPSAARQLAHQLHLQLSPISEAFSQEQGTPAQHYPAPVHAHGHTSTQGQAGHGDAGQLHHGFPGQLHADAHAYDAYVSSGGAYADEGADVCAGGGAGVSAWQLQAQAPASTTPDHSWQQADVEQQPQHQHLHQHMQQYHQQQQDMQQPYRQQPQVHRTPSGHPTGYAAAAADSAWHMSRHEEAAAKPPRSRVRPPALHLPAGADRGSAGGVFGNAAAAQQQREQQQLAQDYYQQQREQHGQQQQQQQHNEQYALYQPPQQQQLQQQQWATGSLARDMQCGVVQRNSAGGLPYTTAADAGSNGGEADLHAAKCDRRATADSTQLQRQLLQQQLQAPPPYHPQQQQQWNHAQRGWQHPQQQQQQYPEAWTAAGSGGSSNVGDLIVALQRTTGGGSRHGAAEPMHIYNADASVAANISMGGQPAAMGLPGSGTPSRRSLAGLERSSGWLESGGGAAAAAANGAGGGVGSEQLYGSYSSSSAVDAAGSNGGSIETLLQSLRRLSDRTAAAAAGAEGAAPLAPEAPALAEPAGGLPMLAGVRQRLSFRSGADAEYNTGQCSATTLQDHYQQQQQQREGGRAAEPLYWGSGGGHSSSAVVSASTTAGGAEPGSATRGRFRPPSPLDLDRLLGKLHSASTAGTSSRRTTAEAAAGAGGYSDSLGGFGGSSSMGAGESSRQGTVDATATAAGGVGGASGVGQSVNGAGDIGTLLGMLHRATADSRRGTGDTPMSAAGSSSVADHGSTDMPAGEPKSVRGTVESRRGTAEGAVSPGTGGARAAADSIGQLLGLLHRATAESRQGTTEGSAGLASDFGSTVGVEHQVPPVHGADDSRASTTKGAAAASSAAGLSARAEDIGQLLGMLHRATAESRRGTAEASPLGGANRRVTGESPLGMASRRRTAEPAGTGHYEPAAAAGSEPAAAAYGGGPCGEIGGVHDVAEAAAVLLPLTQDGAGAGQGFDSIEHAWGSDAGNKTSTAGLDSTMQQQQVPSVAGSGSHSVAELIAALRRATGDSRRNTAEVHAAAAAGGDTDAAAGGVDASPDRRDAGKGQKPHLSLKLPSDYSGGKDAEASAQQLPAQAAAFSDSDGSSISNAGGSSDGSSGDGTAAGQAEDANSVGGLISALQCIAAASKLQEAAAIAPEVAAITQCHVAAVERQADAMHGSAYAQLVKQLSFELSELNKQELKSMQQQQEGIDHNMEVGAKAASGDVAGLLSSLKAPAATAAVADMEEAAVAMSSGSQGLQQLVAALRRVTTERARESAATDTAAVATGPRGDMQQQQQQQEQLLLQLSQHLGVGQHEDAAAAADAQGRQVCSDGHGDRSGGGSNSLEALLSALQATSIRHAGGPTPAAAVAEAAAVPLPMSQDAAAAAAAPGGSSSGPVVQELIAYHERISTQYSGSPAAAAAAAAKAASCSGGGDGGVSNDSRSSSHDVQDLIAALRRATDSKCWPEGAAAPDDDAADTAAAKSKSSANTQAHTSNGYCSSVEQLLQQLAVSAAKLQPPQQAPNRATDSTTAAAEAIGGQLAADGSTAVLPAGLQQTAEPAPDAEVSPPDSCRACSSNSASEGALPSPTATAAAAAVDSEACRTGSPVARFTASPALDAATAPVAQTSVISTDVAPGSDHLQNSDGGFGELESPVATSEGNKCASKSESVACITPSRTPSRSPGRLLAGGVQVHTSAGHLFLQLPEQQDGAAAIAACAAAAAAAAAGNIPKSLEHVFALVDGAPHNSPVCRSDGATPQAKQHQQQQQQQETEAQAVAQGISSSCQTHSTMGLDMSSLAVVFDRQVPADVKQHLSEELAACGATVMAGAPHLGCGANMVVAEPEAATALLPLLLDIVTPTWLAKALKQQHGQRDVGQAGTGAGPLSVGQRLVRLSPDVARAVGLQLQQGGTAAAAVSSEQEHPRTASTAAIDCGGGLRVLDKWGSTLSSNGGCEDSSPKEQQQQQQQVPVLVVPRGYAATSAGDNMPVLLQEVQGDYQQQQQQQMMMMPAALLTDQLWSVGQHPRMVAEEELEAVVLPGSMCSTLTILLPQSSCSLLGHAAVTCVPSDPAKGLTCGDVLAAVYRFYQQDVLLQLDGQAVQPAGGTTVSQPADAVDCAGPCLAADGGLHEAQDKSCADSSGSGTRTQSQLVKRVQLLGHKQMFEGMFRVTRDPCSTVYEVSLA